MSEVKKMNKKINLDKVAEKAYSGKSSEEITKPNISLLDRDVVYTDYFYRDNEMFRPDLNEH